MSEATEKQLLRLVLQALIREQSEGEWDDKTIARDAEKFLERLWPLTQWRFDAPPLRTGDK
jgi:hypothetical protein